MIVLRRHTPIRLFACLVACEMLGVCARPVCAEDHEAQVQIEWGGGEPQTWFGEIEADGGRIFDVQPIGIDESTVGSVIAFRDRLEVVERQPQSYNGVRFGITGERLQSIHIRFANVAERTPKSLTVTFDELIELTRHAKSIPLDDTGNRIWIRRAPRDDLRVNVGRSHLVFAPGESWSIDVIPHLWPGKSRSPQNCELQIVDREGEIVWSETRSALTSTRGENSLKKIPVSVPRREGVYSLQIKFTSPALRFSPSFGPERVLATRQIRFVVIDNEKPNRPSRIESRSETVFEFDPVEDHWWDRLKRLPQWKILPGLRHDGRLSNREVSQVEHGGRSWVSIPPGGWQAYPLPVDQLRGRHLLTIEYPGDLPQTTVVSVVEPNGAGKIVPIGLDTSFHVPDPVLPGVMITKEQLTHAIPFWPNTKSPLLVISNANGEHDTVIGRISVSRTRDVKHVEPSSAGRRAVIASFHRPLFPDCFCANDELDDSTKRAFEDWQTFYDGGRRMVEYLRENGFDGVALTCFADGSSLFPDATIGPSPRFDRGLFFSDGRDPVRKDVMEMLFRLCDREGIVLIPTLEFNAPLANLEMIIRSNRVEAGGILLKAPKSPGIDKDASPHWPRYNASNDRVQDAMLAVVRSVVKRYSHHDSFGGIKIDVTPASSVYFPGLSWGMDRQTVERFRTSQERSSQQVVKPRRGVVSPSSLRTAETSQTSVSARFTSSDRIEWRKWRCQRILDFYRNAQREVTTAKRDAKLFVAWASLINERLLPDEIGRSLTMKIDIDTQLQNVGYDIQKLADNGIVVPQPRRIGPELGVLQHPAEAELYHSKSKDIDRLFRKSRAAEFYHVPVRKRLPSFDRISPFGRENTFMSLVSCVAWSDFQTRERFAHALATNDNRWLFDGGILLPLGQEQPLRAFMRVFRQLPDREFKDSERQKDLRPLVVRHLVDEGETLFYAVNDSPWPVTADLMFQGPTSRLRIRSIGHSFEDDPRLNVEKDGSHILRLKLQPYGLVAFAFPSANVKLVSGSTQVPVFVERVLAQRLEELNSRKRTLFQPLSLPVLSNADFEETSDDDVVPGWTKSGNGTIEQKRITTDGSENFALSIKTGSQGLIVRTAEFELANIKQVSVKFAAMADKSHFVRFALEQNGRDVESWEPEDLRSWDNGRPEWTTYVLPAKTLRDEKPSSESLERTFQLRIELSPNCEVLLDDFEIYNIVLLDREEKQRLGHLISLAYHQRRERYYGDCYRFLGGYWPQYLMQYVPKSPTPSPKITNRPVKRKPQKTSRRWLPFLPGLPRLK